MSYLISQPRDFDPKPDITIFVQRHDVTSVSGTVITNSHIEEFDSSVAPQILIDLGKDLREKFCGLLQEIAAGALDGCDPIEARLAEIRDIGKSICTGFFGSEQLPNRLSDNLKALELGTILFVSPDLSLPWEFFSWEDVASPCKFDNFWGVQAIVVRAIRPRTSHGNEITYQHLPSVGLFPYSELTNVTAQEIPIFQSLEAQKKLLLKQWDSVAGGWDLNRDHFKTFWKEGAFQVAHFACHADRGNRSSDAHFTIDRRLAVPLLKLKLAYTANERLENEPLVVFNACNTGNADPMTNFDFVTTFADLGSRGIIATECAVPDSLAHLFPDKFYSFFLPYNSETSGRTGLCIGLSMHKSRIELWEKNVNPMGLLYSLYAHPGFFLKGPKVN